MRYVFKLPDVGEGIATAEIVEYLVKVGDQVSADQPVVRIETDKAVVELPCPVKGVIEEIPFNPGDSVEVGQTILVIETEESAKQERAESLEPKEEPPAEKKPAPAAETPPPSPSMKERPEGEATPSPPAARVQATPHTRKLARELKVDINTVQGTGPHGRITDEDVRKAAEGEKAAPPAKPEPAAAPKREEAMPESEAAGVDYDKYGPIRREPLRGVRKRIAEVMVKSVSTIPHVTHFDEADVTELMAVVEREKPLAESRGFKLTVLAFVIKAAAAGLKQFPMLNCSLDDQSGDVVYKDYYNIGFATDTESGLMVPVIRDVDRKSVLQIAGELQELSKKARDRSIELDDMRGGTFTVTNVGALGGSWATPIIVHPQVAILCPLRARPKAMVQDGQVAIRTIMPLTLSFDHRVLDGADAARYLNFVIGLLNDPMRMLVDMA